MVILFSVGLIAFVCSLAAAFAVRAYVHTAVPLVGSFFGFEPVQNSGIAFSVHFPFLIQTLLIAFALILITFTGIRSATNRLQQVGFGLIIGGALGNVVDRIIHGSVTDFIQVGSFYLFNVADSCITMGVVVLLTEVAVARWKGWRA